MRLFWLLLGCATASWTVAELIWGYYALILTEEVPVPSWADLGYLSAIPLTVAALVVHPATRGSGIRKARSVFEGLVIAIEPMVNIGGPDVMLGPDGWTVTTKDGTLSAHWEHTVAITAAGPRILTATVDGTT